MKRLFLVRHCKAAGQHPDAPLTEEGRAQADELARFFHRVPIDHIVSSPYERAVATIRPLAEQSKRPIHTDERLRERVLSSDDAPDWMERLRASFDDLDARFPGGETSGEAMKRGVSLIEELMREPHATIVLVSHGNLISLLMKHFDRNIGFEQWRALTNPDVHELTFSEDSGELVAMRRIWR